MNGLSEAMMKVQIEVEIREGRKQSFSIEDASWDALTREIITFIDSIRATQSQQNEPSPMPLISSQNQQHNDYSDINSNGHPDAHHQNNVNNDIYFQPRHGSQNSHNSPTPPQGDTLTIKERLELFLKAEYGNRWFNSLEVKEHYEQAYGTYINLSTVSTYCARMYRDGILERRGNRIQRQYHLTRQQRYAEGTAFPVRPTI